MLESAERSRVNLQEILLVQLVLPAAIQKGEKAGQVAMSENRSGT